MSETDAKTAAEATATPKGADAATDTPKGETKGGDNVVALDTARQEGAVQAAADATAIVETCSLAGFADKAADFLKEGITLEEVRQRLQTLQAQADRTITSGHHMPGTPSGGGSSLASLNPTAIYRRRKEAMKRANSEDRLA